MTRGNNQAKSLMILLICIFMIISITSPAIALEGKHHGEGEGNSDGGNNSPGSDPNSSNDSSGSGNQQGQGKQGEEDSGPKTGQKQNLGNQSGGGCNESQKRYQNRKMNHSGSQRQYRIRSRWNLNNTTDAFEINFISDPEPSLKLEYMPSGNESNVQLSFEIILNKIVEFFDVNNNNRYDHSDEVSSNYKFDSVNFTDLIYYNETLPSGESIVRAGTHTIDNIFSIDMMISDNFTPCYKHLISPSEMKIDFVIQNYPYVDNNTQLALLMELVTDHDLDIEEDSFDEKKGFASNETAINISSMNHSGFFSWLNTANIDGVNQSIHASIFKEENFGGNGLELDKYLAISYPRGTQIIHDPKIGVVSQSFSSFSLASVTLNEIGVELSIFISYIFSCAIAILLFIGIVTLRKRF